MVISTTTFTLFTKMSFLNRRYEGEKTTKKYKCNKEAGHSWCYLKRNICEQWLLLPAAPLSCSCRRAGCFLRPWWWEGSETVVRTGGKAVGPPRWWSPAPLRDHRGKWAGTSHGNTRPAQTSDTKVSLLAETSDGGPIWLTDQHLTVLKFVMLIFTILWMKL